ncbi:Flp pilus assembly protein CpaB [Roseovarius sp. TE539]|uniref:Flp pilus assembly protein CpaB n=1 Tax=Roseovarius sp. TE539 TaxID=2249812 RepID=UPI000DDF15BE|nr:Flp pilus assembly protein CpaB [Roseovarius sp. TE539]RBI76959.1 Flp pilus assembly protein CpaB [Roseovarius sp. TE539]
MRLVFGLVLVLGLGLAGFAVYMAKNYIQSYQTQLEKERKQRAPAIKTTDVIVAGRPLAYGDRITQEDVRRVKFPVDALPEGTFESVEILLPEGEEKPRTVLRSLAENEVLLASKVTEPGASAGITTKLKRGMRAFAIKVDLSSGVSGFLRPGDYVDIYWTGKVGSERLRTEGDSTGEVTKLIEGGMELIAVDQVSDTNTTGAIDARTVTVSARPQQVAALAQAQATGRLSLSLVGVGDTSVSEVVEVDQRRLLGIAEAAPEAPEAPKKEVCTIRTRRGSEVIETQIPCTN